MMSNETIRLIEPTLSLRADFYSLAEEFLAEGDQRYREAIADLKASSIYVLTRRSAAIWHPAEFHTAHFGWSATSKGSSVVPDYATLSMRFLKRKEDTSATTFVRRNDAGGMELKFCE